MTKKTPLYNEHVQLGAKMVPFAGFDMPVQYAGLVEEHNTVRHTAGLFDVSHMGEFSFTGAEALSFLNYLTANNVAKLVDGQAQYSLLCNKTGGLVDDILVYRKSADDFIMVVNASNIEKDFAWVSQFKSQFPNCTLKNKSDETCLIAFQGPKAVEIIQKLTDAPITGLKTFHFITATLAGQKDCILARTGYTGEDGVEIFCKNEQAVPLWKAILKTGAPYGAQPIGLGARDTLRLEARLSLYEHEITDETNPLEAGLSWVVKFDKGDFVGKSALEKIKAAGLRRQIVGFKLLDKGIPRQGYPIVNTDKQPVGVVTSGTFSPTLQVGIGLGYVPTELIAIGTKFNIDIRGTLKLAEVVATPFYRSDGK